jgi:hypothetical protein
VLADPLGRDGDRRQLRNLPFGDVVRADRHQGHVLGHPAAEPAQYVEERADDRLVLDDEAGEVRVLAQ